MKYKVGDRVIVRTDLVGGHFYPFPYPSCDELFFSSEMKKFCGCTYKVISIDEFGEVYKLSLGDEQDKWIFNDVMLMSASEVRSLICKRNIK